MPQVDLLSLSLSLSLFLSLNKNFLITLPWSSHIVSSSNAKKQFKIFA